MKTELKKKYGPIGYHILALEDLHKRKTFIGQGGESDNGGAIIASLVSTFKSAASSISSLGWRSIVESNVKIPEALDSAIEMLGNAATAAGRGLVDIIKAVYAKLVALWNYVDSWFRGSDSSASGAAVAEARGEYSTFFSGLANYILQTSFFTNTARRIASGLRLVFEAVRDAIYGAADMMMQVFYGALETGYSMAKKQVTRISVEMLLAAGGMLNAVKSSAAFIDTKYREYARVIMNAVPVVQKIMNGTSVLASWIFTGIDEITAGWISKFLGWLSSVITNVISVASTIVQGVMFLAPFFNKLFNGLAVELKEALLPAMQAEAQSAGSFLPNAMVLEFQLLDQEEDMPPEEKAAIKSALRMLATHKRAMENATAKQKQREYEGSGSAAITTLLTNYLTEGTLSMDQVNEVFEQSAITGGLTMQQSVLMNRAVEKTANEALLAVYAKLTRATAQQSPESVETRIGDDETTPEEDKAIADYKKMSRPELESELKHATEELISELEAANAFSQQASKLEKFDISTAKDAITTARGKYAIGITLNSIRGEQRAAVKDRMAKYFVDTDAARRKVNTINYVLNGFKDEGYTKGVKSAAYVIALAITAYGLWNLYFFLLDVNISGYIAEMKFGSDKTFRQMFEVPPTVNQGPTLGDKTETIVNSLPSPAGLLETIFSWIGTAQKTYQNTVGPVNPIDALDVRKVYAHFQEAMYGDLTSLIKARRYANLITLVVSYIPPATAIFMSTWFCLTSGVFMFIEAIAGRRQYTDTFLAVFRKGANSVLMAAGLFIRAFSIACVSYVSTSYMDQWGMVSQLAPLVGSLFFLNPAFIVSSIGTIGMSAASSITSGIRDLNNVLTNVPDDTWKLTKKQMRTIFPRKFEHEISRTEYLRFLSIHKATNANSNLRIFSAFIRENYGVGQLTEKDIDTILDDANTEYLRAALSQSNNVPQYPNQQLLPPQQGVFLLDVGPVELEEEEENLPKRSTRVPRQRREVEPALLAPSPPASAVPSRVLREGRARSPRVAPPK